MKDHLRQAREQAAAQELGRKTVIWTLFRGPILALGGLVGVVLAGWWGIRKVGEADVPWVRLVLLLVLVVVLMVVLAWLLISGLGGRRGPRPPRMPRGF